MIQKPSQRIGNAIIELLFGKQVWLTGISPLYKFPCKTCGLYVTQKDTEAHALLHSESERSESEEYRAAH